LERELCASYIGLREEPRGRGEAVAWELAGRPLMAAAGGSVRRLRERKERVGECGEGVRVRWGGGAARGSRGGGTAAREAARPVATRGRGAAA
jgi:hypothetical protein